MCVYKEPQNPRPWAYLARAACVSLMLLRSLSAHRQRCGPKLAVLAQHPATGQLTNFPVGQLSCCDRPRDCRVCRRPLARIQQWARHGLQDASAVIRVEHHLWCWCLCAGRRSPLSSEACCKCPVCRTQFAGALHCVQVQAQSVVSRHLALSSPADPDSHGPQF